jgi:hypothetical protein
MLNTPLISFVVKRKFRKLALLLSSDKGPDWFLGGY